MSTQSNNPHLAILFADISGSTSLYDKLGDQVARRMVAECLSVMTEVVDRYQGTVIKTIGDEILCTFKNAEVAVLAACDMQVAVEEKRPGGGAPMHIRIGLHSGPVLQEDGDIHGDTVNTAARITAITRARQILTTREVAESLPAGLSNRVRQIMRREFRGKGAATEVYQVVWEKEDTTSTRIGLSRFRKPRESRNELMLRYGQQVIILNEVFKSIVLGRSETCDIVVSHTLASRQHARIEIRFNKLVIADHSVNGTHIRYSDGQVVTISQEEITLHGSGQISLGWPFSEDPTDLIEFLVQ